MLELWVLEPVSGLARTCVRAEGSPDSHRRGALSMTGPACVVTLAGEACAWAGDRSAPASPEGSES